MARSEYTLGRAARSSRLIVTSAIDQLTSERGGHPILLLLDEFATLQNLAAI